MKTFKIAVQWTVCGEMEVKAKTLQDAIEIVENDPELPLPEGEYIDDSFLVNAEMTEFLNNPKNFD
jgi:hypothetical protein